MPLPDHNQLPDVVVDFQTGELLHTGVVHQWVKAMAEFYLDFDHADPPTDNQVWAKDPTSGLYVGTDMGGGGGPHTHPITDLEILGALLGDVVKFDGVVADWSPDLVGGGGSQYEFSTELYLRSDVPSGVGNGNSGLSWLNAKRTIAGANAAAPSTGAIIKFAPQRHDLDSWPVVFGQKRLSFEGPEGPSARWQSGNERAVIGAASGSLLGLFLLDTFTIVQTLAIILFIISVVSVLLKNLPGPRCTPPSGRRWASAGAGARGA